MSAALEELQIEIDEALLKLSPRQRKFVEVYGPGNMVQTQAAIAAGYAPRTIANNAARAYKSTKHVIQLIRRKMQLERGEHVADHRLKLSELYDLCADPNSDSWEPRTAHSIRRTLMEVDGLIKGTAENTGSVTINIIDPVANISAESDTYENDQSGDVQALSSNKGALIEHEPTKNQ